MYKLIISTNMDFQRHSSGFDIHIIPIIAK